MQRIAQAFDGEQYDLKYLAVDVELAQHKFFVMEKLEVDSSQELRMRVRTNSPTEDKFGGRRTRERLAKVVEPLMCLRGLRQVQVTGVLPPEAVSKFRDAVIQTGKTDQKDEETMKSAKRRRLC